MPLRGGWPQHEIRGCMIVLRKQRSGFDPLRHISFLLFPSTPVVVVDRCSMPLRGEWPQYEIHFSGCI
jgi:hypothetical protein